jgi:hypothetical protein
MLQAANSVLKIFQGNLKRQHPNGIKTRQTETVKTKPKRRRLSNSHKSE